MYAYVYMDLRWGNKRLFKTEGSYLGMFLSDLSSAIPPQQSASQMDEHKALCQSLKRLQALDKAPEQNWTVTIVTIIMILMVAMRKQGLQKETTIVQLPNISPNK